MRGWASERVMVLVVAAGLPASVLAQGPLGEPFPAVLELADLDGEIGLRIEGLQVLDNFGRAVGGLGDFNGDGIDDIIIGAPRTDPGGSPGGGQATIIFGSASGFPDVLFAADLDETSGLVLQGLRSAFDTGERAGTAVAGAGDINGDGVPDAIVGAYNAGIDGGDRVGKAYVVFGRQDGAFGASLRLADLDGENGFTMVGSDPLDFSGSAVASAGDVDGDGFEDVIVGVPGGGTGGYGTFYYYCCPGEAYVIYGRDEPGGESFPAEFELNPGPPTGQSGIFGGGIIGGLGTSVAAAGDVNGDGFGDVIAGAPRVDEYYGEAYVVFGGPTGLRSSTFVRGLSGTDGFTMTLADRDGADFSAASVDTAGDFNGDGIDDVIVSSPNRGSFVVFGRADGFPADVFLDELDGTDGIRLGGVYGGVEVASVGDLNGDGMADIAVGRLGATTSGGTQAGSVHVVFGSRDGFPAVFDLTSLDGSKGFRIDGGMPFDQLGRDIARAGDFNGDGVDDLVIGTRNQQFAVVGRAYVVFGRAPACAADLDGDGELTLFDFLEFQNLFDAGDPRADFDGDGDFTIFDFLAFQNAFDAGCP